MGTDWEAFARLMEEVRQAEADLKLKPQEEIFYRGHADLTWTLIPSLFRQRSTEVRTTVWELEQTLFFQFRALARELYSSDRTDWDVLFHMQHHGVPTRLLDWTSVFGVALYFALLDFKAEKSLTPCLWLLNPYRLNEITWDVRKLFNTKYLARDEQNNRSYDYGEILVEAHRGTESQSKHKKWGEIPWEAPLAIYDDQRSDRMYAQRGWFTIHGLEEDPLEGTTGNYPDFLKRVPIPEAAIPAARQFLVLSGIGHRQLFPGLDGLAKTINERFGISR